MDEQVMWTVWQRKIVGDGEWRTVAELPEDQAEAMAKAKRAVGFAAVATPSVPYPDDDLALAVLFGGLDAVHDLASGSREMAMYFRPMSLGPRRPLRPTPKSEQGSR